MSRGGGFPGHKAGVGSVEEGRSSLLNEETSF